jgi:hydrogenase nickel incorporation protein HypA/HybF
MHEMALVRNVVDIVVDQAEKSGAKEVKTVYLTIGSGRDVVVEYLDGLFQFLARGTVAEHAELVVQTTPMTVRCNKCGFIFPINVFKQETWTCPSCKAEKDYTLNSGMEFMINRIEVVGEKPAAKAEEQAGE